MTSEQRSDSAPAPAKGERWSREWLLTLVLFLTTALAFLVCYLIAQPFLPTLAWALALTIITHPLHDWIARRLNHRNWAAALAVVIVALAIVAPAIFVTQKIVREAAYGLQTIRTEAESVRWQAVIENNPALERIVSWIKAQLDLTGTTQSVTAAVTTGRSLLRNSVWMIAELLITFFFLFHFFRDGAAVVGMLRSLSPLSDTETDEVFRYVTDTIYATVYGTLAVAAIQGLLGGLMFWWLGLPLPLLWGTVMGLLAIVPVLGPFIIWLPAAAFLALGGNWGKALILAGWGLVVVSLIDNLLYPVLVGKRLKLHTVLVFVAIVGGLVLFGSSGLILGPVVLTITVALLDIWRKRLASGRPPSA